MSAAFLIAAKDSLQRLRDSSAIVMALVLPLALSLVLSLVLGGVADEGMSFRLVVVDEDGGALARTFRTEVLRAAEEGGAIEVADADSVAEARRMVDEGRAQAAIVVPAGFSAAVQAGASPALEVLGDVDESLATDVAGALAEGFAQQLNGTRVAVATVIHVGGGEPDPAALGDLVQRASAVPSPVALEDFSASRKELDSDTYFAAGMAVFFLFFTVQFGVSSLLEERKQGTMRRLLAAPISRAAILSGKLLGAFLLGVVSMAVLIAGTSLLLGAHWGNPVGVTLLVLAGVLAALSITALVATLARSTEQAGSWQSIIALVLGMLGGSFFPLSQAGGFFASLSLLTPHAWFLRGLADLSGGSGPAAVLPSVAAILAFAVVTGSVAAARLGRLSQP